MRRWKPRVVLFIGHADAEHGTTGERTLGLTDPAGGLVMMDPKTIVDIIGAGKDRLELVVLNGCQSEAMCEALATRFRVPTIGWSTITHDAAAKRFSIGACGQLVVRRAG